MIDHKTLKLIKQYNKDRNEAVMSMDVEKFKAFYKKWEKYMDVPLPADNVLEITMRKMACAIYTLPLEVREEAKQWLLERGYKEGLL